jgi:hypothetical protein
MKRQLAILFIAICLSFNIKAQNLLADFPLSSNGSDISGHGYTMAIHNGTYSSGGVYFTGVYQNSYGYVNGITGFTHTAPFSVSVDFMVDTIYPSGTFPVIIAGSG